jgi:hypothetical protein
VHRRDGALDLLQPFPRLRRYTHHCVAQGKMRSGNASRVIPYDWSLYPQTCRQEKLWHQVLGRTLYRGSTSFEWLTCQVPGVLGHGTGSLMQACVKVVKADTGLGALHLFENDVSRG